MDGVLYVLVFALFTVNDGFLVQVPGSKTVSKPITYEECRKGLAAYDEKYGGTKTNYIAACRPAGTQV